MNYVQDYVSCLINFGHYYSILLRASILKYLNGHQYLTFIAEKIHILRQTQNRTTFVQQFLRKTL